jgi:hypothetical protein
VESLKLRAEMDTEKAGVAFVVVTRKSSTASLSQSLARGPIGINIEFGGAQGIIYFGTSYCETMWRQGNEIRILQIEVVQQISRPHIGSEKSINTNRIPGLLSHIAT